MHNIFVFCEEQNIIYIINIGKLFAPSFESMFRYVLDVHLLMERPCRLAVDTGKGWHREHGHGMPGKCRYELAKCSGSFSKLGIGGAWKPRYPADGGEWGV